MTNAFGTQLAERRPDAVRPGCFRSMDGNTGTCISPVVEVAEKLASRKTPLITSQIQRGDAVTVRQQCFQPTQAGFFTKGAAHNASQTHINIMLLAASTDAINDRFNHARYRQMMSHRHIAGGKPRFCVVNSREGGVLKAFQRHAVEYIQRTRYVNAKVQFVQEVNQIRFVFSDLNMWKQCFQRAGRESNLY